MSNSYEAPLAKRMSVGESVRRLRRRRRLTQYELAKLAGLPLSALCAIENDRQCLEIKQTQRLALALGCHPIDLLIPGGALAVAPAQPASRLYLIRCG